MIVKLRSDKYGKQFMVMRDIPNVVHSNLLVGSDGWISLDYYLNDLRADASFVDLACSYDIVKVYVPKREYALCGSKDITDPQLFVKIWEREPDEPPIEMTISQIKEKLGIDNLKIIE
jgi:hypothetical protein